MRRLFANLGLQAMSIHLQGINHTMQFLRCSAPHLTFRSFMQTGTQFAWKTSFSFVDVKIEELTMGLPAFPLLIQNFSMMNGQCEQTNHRYSLSVLLRICIIPSYHYRSAPSVAAQPVMCQVVFYLHVSSHHYIQYYSLLNPKRPGPLCPEPVLLNIR